MIRLALTWLVACNGQPPVPLPERKLSEIPSPISRMVATSDIRGFMVQPAQAPSDAVLLLAPSDENVARKQAMQAAEQGSVALVIGPGVDVDAARRYLKGIPGVQNLTTRCLRTDCQEP